MAGHFRKFLLFFISMCLFVFKAAGPWYTLIYNIFHTFEEDSRPKYITLWPGLDKHDCRVETAKTTEPDQDHGGVNMARQG